MNCLFVFWFWIYSFFLFRYESSLHSWRWPHTRQLTYECSVSVSFLKRLLDLVNLTLKPQFHCIHLKISFQFYFYSCALRQRFHSHSIHRKENNNKNRTIFTNAWNVFNTYFFYRFHLSGHFLFVPWINLNDSVLPKGHKREKKFSNFFSIRHI